MREQHNRVLLIHVTCVAVLVVLAIALNVFTWMATPDPFPDTLWNIMVMPCMRVMALLGGMVLVIDGATSPVTLRLLRMHKRRKLLAN